MAAEPRPVEQTAKEVKRDIDQGKLNEGTEALRQGYLDWMKGGKDEGQFWKTMQTAGGLTESDMQHLSLAFASANFNSMSEKSMTTGNPYIDATTLGRFDGSLRHGAQSPESRFAQTMDQHLQKALDTDPAFHHSFFGLGMETNLHGTGNYIFKDSLDERIAAINGEDRGRAIAGDTARALDAKGADQRTLFDRMANGQPTLTPDAIRKAGDNLGAYSPQEQEVIKGMIKGMDDSGSPEGNAMSRLQDSNKGYGITRDKLNGIEQDPQYKGADAPQQPPEQPAPGQLTGDVAKAGLDAIVGLPQDARGKILKGDGISRQSVDDYLKDQNNQMSANQREALQKLRDGLPADNKPVSIADVVSTAGYKTPDGKPDDQGFTKHVKDLKADATATLGALHDNVDGSKIKDQNGNITPETIDARMKAIADEAAKNNGGPVSGNPEYTSLQRLQQHFKDISSDGKQITQADLDRYAQGNDQEKFAGFKEGGQQPQPPKPETPPVNPDQVKEDADKLAAGQTVKLGRGPIYDQAMHILQERAKTTGEQVTPQAARQLLADMAKLNHWPGSDAQWGAYVKDGNPRHLPKALNGAMIANMDMKVPGGNASPDAVHAAAEKRLPAPDLKLTPEQIAEVKKNAGPGAANAPVEAINRYVATHPEALGDHLNAEQKAAAQAWQAQLAAYEKALQEYMDKQQNPQPPT